MKPSRSRLALIVLSLPVMCAWAQSPPLVIVQDDGGASALGYYRALNLQGGTFTPTTPDGVLTVPAPPMARYTESDLLPVRSALLTSGPVEARTLSAPGLTPIFLMGSDERSRLWLKEHLGTLQHLRAVGLVVQVESRDALESLRALAPGLTLTAVSGDDLAKRLHLRHYPVLITATGIEQ